MRAAQFRGAIFASVIALTLTFSCTASAEPLQLTAVSASAEIYSIGGGPIVRVRLSDSSRTAFAAFTSAQVGSSVDFRVDGKSLMKPVIRNPITGGVFLVPTNSLEEARQLADRISQGGDEAGGRPRPQRDTIE